MATIFKILESHTEDDNITDNDKSFILNQQNQLNSTSQLHDLDEGSQSMDKQQLLQLQIKQLKMQNKFLRKKINELNSEKGEQRRQSKRKGIMGKGTVKEEVDVNYMNVDFFFKQITTLMNSMVDLFKVQFTEDEIKKYKTQFPKPEQIITAQKKYVVFKKALLAKKLQKIAFESEEKRYPMLLQVFTNYYKVKQECDKYIREVVDELSSRALELNKLIFNSTAMKKQSVRGSSSRKTIHTFDDTVIVDKILDSECHLTSPSKLRKHTLPPSFGLMKSDVKKRSETEQKHID